MRFIMLHSARKATPARWIRAVLAATAWTFALQAHAAVAILTADRDNTLIQDAAGNVSNGAGDAIYTGRTQRDGLRRGLLHFDVSSIPARATITSVTLTLRLVRTRPDTYVVNIHRALASWGEGTSSSGGGIGDAATPGDATWTQRFFGAVPAQPWASPGGDFSVAPSASLMVGGTLAPFNWASTTGGNEALRSDVAAWVNSPASNHGWVVVADASNDAKAFGSREQPVASYRPTLVVNYEPPVAQVPLPSWGVAAIALALAVLGAASNAVRNRTA